MKLAIVVGTRPEIIRLSATINLARKLFDTILIHTGQNYDYELNDIFFKELHVDAPNYYLDCSRDNIGSTIGDIISKTYNLFSELKPDAVMVLGDTNSCLCAYSAKRLKIPIFHLEAGNRCYDPNVPEEINRRLIDNLSDINICYMEHARRNLLQEGIKPQYTFVTGSPMTEVINNIRDEIDKSTILDNMGLEKGKYIIMSTHREENINNSNNFKEIVNSIIRIYETFKTKIVISVHPRTRKRFEQESGETISYFENNKDIIFSKPFGIIDYCCLQKNSLCVISDSGTLSEEASILHFPGILLRTSTEHPEAIDAGNIVLGDIKWESLEHNIKLMINKKEWTPVSDYETKNFSEKVCNIVSGYKSVINKFIWMK